MKNEPESVSAPVQPGPRPKCPTCGGKVVLRSTPIQFSGRPFCGMQCPKCMPEGTWWINEPEDLAAFFPVAAPSAPEVDEKRLAEITVEFVQQWRHENLGCPAHKGNGENSLICKEWTDKDVTDFLLEQIESLRRRVPTTTELPDYRKWVNDIERLKGQPATVPATPEPFRKVIEQVRKEAVDFKTTATKNGGKKAQIRYYEGALDALVRIDHLLERERPTTQGTPEGAK